MHSPIFLCRTYAPVCCRVRLMKAMSSPVLSRPFLKKPPGTGAFLSPPIATALVNCFYFCVSDTAQYTCLEANRISALYIGISPTDA
ncbi:hypothetical protein M404DRAFT_521103 [Pisolithus tinctorius Marx 270]|uniref:Uncharacterized protein n=1 Tax=Pisolithus tinctorius Marx 270 TaxID=870435 RepID=A0A0C3K6X5_PISTI|nr:hypothetical protein M404DRAFT_521103 [Pisolithus tinctorius Marx 270]